MIDIFQSLFSLSGIQIVVLFFKLFGVAFSSMYVVYSLVVWRQVTIMSQTVQVIDSGPVTREELIIILARLEIILSIILCIFSFTLFIF